MTDFLNMSYLTFKYQMKLTKRKRYVALTQFQERNWVS